MPMRLRYITTIENLIADIYVDEIQSDSIIDESDLFANTVTLDEKYEALTILQIEKENEFIGFLCCPATYNDGVFDYKYQPNSGIEVNLNAESKKVSEIKISQVDSGFWYETSLLRKGTRIYISNDSNAEISEEVNEYIKINYPSAKETDQDEPDAPGPDEAQHARCAHLARARGGACPSPRPPPRVPRLS